MMDTAQMGDLARQNEAQAQGGRPAGQAWRGRWWAWGTALALLGGTAHAQEFPTHPVRIVSITGAGTGVDDFSRLLAKAMGEKLGQSVIIENKPGANGIVAHDTVAKAAADGYTLLYTSAGSVFVNPHAFKKLPYAPSDLVPVARLQAVPIVLTVSGNSPYRTVADLKAAGQANPGKLNWSYSTSGYQVMTVALNAQLKVKAEGVAYKSTTAAVPDLIAGTLDYAMLEVSSATPMVQSQKLRVLAVAAPQRLPQLPVPTFAEVGLGDAALLSWMGLFAPAKTPQAQLDKLSAAAMAFMQSPEAAAHFKQRGTYALGANAQAFAASMGEDQARWKRYIDLAGLKAE